MCGHKTCGGFFVRRIKQNTTSPAVVSAVTKETSDSECEILTTLPPNLDFSKKKKSKETIKNIEAETLSNQAVFDEEQPLPVVDIRPESQAVNQEKSNRYRFFYHQYSPRLITAASASNLPEQIIGFSWRTTGYLNNQPASSNLFRPEISSDSLWLHPNFSKKLIATRFTSNLPEQIISSSMQTTIGSSSNQTRLSLSNQLRSREAPQLFATTADSSDSTWLPADSS
ncbi:5016_t:CDS:2 [Racocetra persica]|uniref:5016_t:CDS:1 n=1 Tax=Racocetra persica TaxID=160502 RepID=A0ACA9MVF1_9GLOM|nr:5016_t:CDS:2 [Racocetra persica]